MLSRRQVRIKVLQALYAHHQSDKTDISRGENELLHSIDKFFSLFYHQLSLLFDINDMAFKHAEESKLKQLPSEEDLNPSLKFLNNLLLASLRKNADLTRILKSRNINWTGNQDIPRRIFRKFRSSALYKSYIQDSGNTFEHDKSIILKLLKKFIYTHRPLFDYYEDLSIHWINDYEQVTFILIKILQSLNSETVFNYRFTDKDDNDFQEDIFFAQTLYKKTINNNQAYLQIISTYTQNWEMDRLAIMDNIIMNMAVCEFLEFPLIPVKVTLNEYIEISKIYSTPKSNIFINGVLDKIVEDFKAEKKIKKIGRGLIEK